MASRVDAGGAPVPRLTLALSKVACDAQYDMDRGNEQMPRCNGCIFVRILIAQLATRERS